MHEVPPEWNEDPDLMMEDYMTSAFKYIFDRQNVFKPLLDFNKQLNCT